MNTLTNERLMEHLRSDLVVPPLVCANGSSLSVQASHGHYCTPKDDQGPWTDVEVGWVVETTGATPWPVRTRYIGDVEDAPAVIHGWVDVQTVIDFVNGNGGLKQED